MERLMRRLNGSLSRSVRRSVQDVFQQSPLDLRFALQKTLDPRVTHTRASSATFVDSSGVLRSAVTNLLLQSEDFSTTWVKDASAVVTTNVATAPNGSVTADKFAVGTSTFPQIAQAATSTVPLTHSFSVYVKAAGLNFIQLRVRNASASTNYFRAIFNLTTGAVTSAIINGTGVIVSATAVSAGDGWWRCTLTGIADTTGTSIQPLAILATDANGTLATSSNSAATDGVLFWGAQLEQASTVGDYVPTTSTINSAPRFTHDPTTGESLGLLVEEARTNTCLQSQAITISSPWASQGTAPTITANAFAAPNGTTTATKVTFAAADSRVVQATISLTSGTIYTFSVYARPVTPGTLNTIRLAAFDTGQQNGPDTALIAGWQRISYTFTAGGTTANGSIQFRNATNNAANDVYLWGAQLEAGAFPTSYIPTTSATVTRAADVAQITGSNFSSWYNQNSGTIYAEYRIPALALGTISSFDDGTSANRWQQRFTASGTRLRFVATGSAIDDVDNALVPSISALNKVAYAATVADQRFASGGVLTTNIRTQPSMPVVTQLQFGVGAASDTSGQIRIKRLTYWPNRLANTTLQQITQP